MGHLGKIAEVQVNGTERPKFGNYLYGAFGRDFLTRDGKRIMVVALTGRQWQSLKEATGIAEACEQIEKLLGVDLDVEGDRFDAREVIAAILKPWTVARTRAQIAAIFDAHDVCWGPYQTFRELVEEDARCSTANPMFRPVEQAGIGTYLMPASPLDLSVSGRLAPQAAPVLGQHTEAVLAGVLGLSGTEIGRLHDDGVVASPAGAAPGAQPRGTVTATTVPPPARDATSSRAPVRAARSAIPASP